MTSGRALLDDAASSAVDLHLPTHAGRLARMPLLLITGSRDQVVDPGVHQAPLVEALGEEGAADVTEVVIDGADHAFSDRRMALTETVVTWLAARFDGPGPELSAASG